MRVYKKITSVLLAMAMMSSVAVIGNTANATDNTDTKTKVSTDTKCTYKTTDEKTTSKKDYADGEAVILLKNNTKVTEGKKLSTTIKDVNSDMVVDDVSKFKTDDETISVATVTSDSLSTEKMVDKLNDSSQIEYAEPNYKYSATSLTKDTYSNLQWSLDNKADTDINPSSVWSKSTPTSSKETVVAVLDTGVDYTHEELKDKMWVNPYPDKLKGTYGYDFTGTYTNHEPMDDFGHGTHCAGIIAAEQNNNKGIAGISQNTKIMAVKWLDCEGGGFLEDVISAYDYVYRAMKLGVNVVAINNSWGGTGNSKILLKLINAVGEMGAISVCAAGNDSQNCDKEYNNEDLYNANDDLFYIDRTDLSVDEDEDLIENKAYRPYPACYDSDYVVTVGATNDKGNVSPYSNYGKDTVDVFAPGDDVLSSVCEGVFNPVINKDKAQTYITKNFNAKADENSDDITVSESSDDAFFDADGDNTGLNYTIKNAQSDTRYSIEIPYTVSDTEQNSEISFMLRINDISNGEEFIGNLIYAEYDAEDTNFNDSLRDVEIYFDDTYSGYWNHITLKSGSKKAGNRLLRFYVTPETDGDLSFSIDGIGVSKGTKNEEQSFDKYDYMTGTSMATPHVVGEIALLKEKNPDMTAKELISAVKGSVTQSSKYDQKSASSGRIDLSKTDKQIPVVSSIENSGSNLILKGANLSNAKVYIDNTQVSLLNNSDTEIKTDSIDYNKEATIKVVTDNGYQVMDRYIISGTRYTQGKTTENYFYDNAITTDGKYIYYINTEGEIVTCKTDGTTVEDDYFAYSKSNKVTYSYKELQKCFENNVKYAGYYTDFTNLQYSNGYLYFIAQVSLSSLSSVVYQTYDYVVKVKLSDKTFTVVDAPENLIGESLAVYNGSMYILGGINTTNNKLSKNVYEYSNDLWTWSSFLPSERALGKAMVADNKIIYTLGTDGTENAPKNLIYDGSKWTESKVSLASKEKKTTLLNDKEFNYYDASVSYVNGGLLYAGTVFNTLGDTFTYNVNNDSFTKLNYYFKTSFNNLIRGIAVDNKFFGISCELATDDTNVTELSFVYYTFPVSSALYKVTVNDKYNKATGAGSYVQNDTATVTGKNQKGYYVKSITVNGKTYSKSSVSFKVTKATTVTVNYAPSVKKITLKPAKKTIKKGKTTTITASITAIKGANKALTWSSSNSKIVKIKKISNTKYKLTALKKGTVTIKAKSKYSTTVGSYKIKVK